MHTTAATIIAAIRPVIPVMPKAKSNAEAKRTVQMVIPETGLFELPTNPTT